jgi:hypothetical protein
MRMPQEGARSWLARAESSQDDFDRFMALWIALNALYSEFQTESERRAIREFVFSDEHRLSQHQMRGVLDHPGAHYFETRIVRDVRGTCSDTAEDAAVLGNTRRPLKPRLKSLLMILYQVRCNLFHGNKTFGRESDTDVISNASGVLECIVKAYLEPARTR